MKPILFSRFCTSIAFFFVLPITQSFAAYSNIPTANNGDQLSVSLWNSVLDYANKAVKQDSAILNVDSVNSRVGIGTASPTSALTISQAASNALSVNADVGYALFSGAGNGGADRLSITANAAGGGTNLLGYNNASSGYSPINYLATAHIFKIGSAEMARISNAGYLGLGTNNPSGLLEIAAPDNGPWQLVFNNGSAVNTWRPFASLDGNYYIYEKNKSWDTSNYIRMTLQAGGNVGIGTTAPAYKLDVNGAVNATSLLVNGVAVGAGGSQWTSGAGLIYYNGGNVGIGTSSPARKFEVFTSDSSQWAIRAYSSSSSYVWTVVDIGSESSWNGYALLNVRYGAGMPNTAFRVNGDGNVGIGISSPVARLDVAGANNSYAGNFVWGATAGQSFGVVISAWTNSSDIALNVNNKALTSTLFRIRGDGNVGIGASNPGYKLEVRSTNVGQTAYIRSDSTSGTNYGVDAEAMWVWATTNIGWYFAATGATNNYAIIVPPGYWNVGIGTTSPANALTVYGPSSAGTSTAGNVLEIHTPSDNGFQAGWNDPGNYTWIQSKNARPFALNPNWGNVGIGTTSPAEKLEISGNVKIWNANSYYFKDAAGTWLGSLGFDSGNLWHLSFPWRNASIESWYNGSITLSTGAPWYTSWVVAIPYWNVGIGTTNPGTKLEVKGISNATGAPGNSGTTAVGNMRIVDASNVAMDFWTMAGYPYPAWIQVHDSANQIYNYPLILQPNGSSVGIGTANPTSPLEVVGNTNWASGWRYGITVTSNDYPTVRFRSLGAGKVSSIGNDNDGGLWFNVNGTDSTYGQLGMVVLPNGDTWIGMVPSGVKLEVNGALRTNGNIVNQAPSNGYLALTGDLPGYANNVYPTLKTNGGTIYFSAGGQYSAYMSAGGVFTAVSDRNKKENFMPVDEKDILSRIDMLPMLKWNYKSEDASVQHIAPIAQDFYTLFHLNGNNDKMISSIDPAGVALVGIKALSSEFKEQKARIEELERKNMELTERNDKQQEDINELLSRIETLEYKIQ